MLSQFARWIRSKSHARSESEGFISCLKNYTAVFEDIITWKNPIHTIIALLIVNIVYIILSLLSIHPLGYIFAIAEIFAIMDATGTKFSRKRNIFVKAGASDGKRTYHYLQQAEAWVKNKAADFITLRENNPTKAFIVMNIILCAIFVIGEKLSLAKLVYLFIMALAIIPLALPYAQQLYAKMYPQTDYNEEIADLLPDTSDQNLQELNFAEEEPPDHSDKLDPLLLPRSTDQLDGPDIYEEESSSSSSVSNLSGSGLLKEFDTTSDESEEEFIPKVTYKQEIESSVKVIEDLASEGWGDRAVTAVWNLGGTLGNLVYTTGTSYKHKNEGYERATLSDDSADEFEIIEDNEWNK